MTKRYLELDAIRGLAALMVVLYHYSTWYMQSNGYSTIVPLFSFEIGKAGVQLFFITSGFVIFLTLDKTKSALDFIISRFSRLFPAYWVAVILTFSIVAFFSLPGREVSFQVALFNLTMLQKWLRIPAVDGVYWTLAVELSFYLIMFCIFLLNWLKRIEFISALWLVVIFIASILKQEYNFYIHWFIELTFLLKYGYLFIAGMMFYRYMTVQSKRALGLILISLLAGFYIGDTPFWILCIFYLIFTLFSMSKLGFISVRPLTFLGAISYSLYLIHQNIGFVIIKILEDSGLANGVTVLLIPTLISIVIATLIYKLVEQPSLNTIRLLWKGSYIRRHYLIIPK